MVNPLDHWIHILFGTRLRITLRGLSGFLVIGFRITLRGLSGFQVPPGLVFPVVLIFAGWKISNNTPKLIILCAYQTF